MKFGIRTMLIVIAIFACAFPIATRWVAVNSQSNLVVDQTATRSEYTLPFVNCISLHEGAWGRPRIVILHRVSDREWVMGNRYPDWLDFDGELPVRIEGRIPRVREKVSVFYAENGAKPRLAMVDFDRLPMENPSWPNPSKLWQLVNDTTIESNW